MSEKVRSCTLVSPPTELKNSKMSEETGGFLVDGPKEMVPPMGLKNSMVAATSSVAGSRKARTVGEDEVLRLGVHADGVEELEDVREDGGVPASS